MISSDQWINLPVGYNLNDHVGVRRFAEFPEEEVVNLGMTLLTEPNLNFNRLISRLLTRRSFPTTTMARGKRPSFLILRCISVSTPWYS